MFGTFRVFFHTDPFISSSPGCQTFSLNLFMLSVSILSGRARKKMDELERLLEIAKSNYTQLGGRLSEDRRRLREDRDSKRCVRSLFICVPYR